MLTYELEQRGDASRYEYLYRCIRNDIEQGAIKAGEKLPSKRALARHLGVSLSTVEGAYAQLAAEGYVQAVERKGYFACDLAMPAAARMPVGFEHTSESAGSVRDLRFAVGLARPAGSAHSSDARGGMGCPPDEDPSCNAHPGPPLAAGFAGGAWPEGVFPYRMWARTVRAVLTEESERSLAAAASDAAGSRRLREAIASYLLGFRGMRVDPEQVVIGAGAQTLYHTIIQLVGRSCRLAVEDPGYPRLASIYRANDVDVVPVQLDGRGVSMRALRKSGADVLHCMPSHQFPTGAAVPVSRRYELLSWASDAPGRYLVEDDYDCEFRLAGRPLPALQSIDASERVIYVNTFTKSLGSAFRIGYLVLPSHLARAFRERLGFYASTVGAIDQLALARFMERGDYERHVNRARNRCRTVRAALVSALKASSLGDRLDVEEADAGLHFVLGIATDARDEDVAAAARAEGVEVVPLAAYCATEEARVSSCHRFVVNDASCDPSCADQAADALARAVEGAERAASLC